MKCSRWIGFGVLVAALPAQAVPVTVAYTYDDLGRLTQANYGTVGSLSYAYDRAGNITLASSTLVDTTATKPSAPAKPTAGDGSSTASVGLTWTSVNGATSYKVFRCADGALATCGSPLASPTGTSYDDSGARAGVPYYYRVKACNSAGCSVASPADTGWRKYSGPTGVSASDNVIGAVSVTWKAPTNVDGSVPVYQVYRSESETGVKARLNGGAVGTGLSFADTTAVAGNIYWYWVKACFSDGVRCGDFSSNVETGVAQPPLTGDLNLLVTPATTLEIDEAANTLRLRQLWVPNQGIKSAVFGWDALKNAWVLNGDLAADEMYLGEIQLWKHYDDQATPQSESIDVFAGGANVASIQFQSPDGVVHDTICHADGADQGINFFNCDAWGLPVGQTDFAAGKYVVTYNLTSGASVTRNFYVGGNYPAQLTIKSPKPGAVNVSVTPAVSWTAFGATGYDFIIRDADQQEVYGIKLNNAIDSNLVYTVPAGALQPNTRYYLTIEANGPVVNGGSKGIKKSLEFRTAP